MEILKGPKDYHMNDVARTIENGKSCIDENGEEIHKMLMYYVRFVFKCDKYVHQKIFFILFILFTNGFVLFIIIADAMKDS